MLPKASKCSRVSRSQQHDRSQRRPFPAAPGPFRRVDATCPYRGHDDAPGKITSAQRPLAIKKRSSRLPLISSAICALMPTELDKGLIREARLLSHARYHAAAVKSHAFSARHFTPRPRLAAALSANERRRAAWQRSKSASGNTPSRADDLLASPPSMLSSIAERITG
jgi:hypothetical protein